MVATDSLPASIGRRYVLLRRLGAGGMGAVYLAIDRLTGEQVALKHVATPQNAPDNDALRVALTREFATLASVRHPNVIGVLDYGFDDQRQPYFTMTLVGGAYTLREAGYNQPLDYKIDLIIQLLQALVYLHRRGIIHRDLKPENVLVTPTGQVKVLDFGLAEMNSRRANAPYAGTLRYMAPEVLKGEPPAETADLYAVGVMAYELLMGRSPFTGNTTQALLENILSSKPDMSGIDILTAGELRRTTRKPAPIDTLSDATQLRHDMTPAPPPTPTILLSENTLQDEISTRLVNHAGRETPAHNADESITSVRPLARIIERLMMKSPHQRYQRAGDVIEHLYAAMHTPRPQETSAIRDSFLQAAPLTGRDHELNQLMAALQDARAGRGSLWLVSGESGVGKSRLLDEMRIRAMVQGVQVLRGQAISDGGLPYRMWHEPLKRLVLGVNVSDTDAAILKQMMPEIERLLERTVPDAPALEATDVQERLLTTISQLVADSCRMASDGILLILEDLQWEMESLRLLHSLQQQVHDLPLLIVCNYRNDEAPNMPHHFPGCQLLHLQRLSADHIVDLSEAMLGEAGRSLPVLSLLQRETEGNPFFLIEIARALAEEAGSLEDIDTQQLPERVFTGGIQTLLRRRLDQVPPRHQRLLQLAAVYGRQVDMRIMSRLASAAQVEDWLTACVNAAVMDRQDGRWRFAHDKLREQLLYSLPPSERTLHYRTVAEAVETTYADALEQQATTLAYLWGNAGDAEREYHYSRIAATAAVATSALVEAHRLNNRALMLLMKGKVPYRDAEEIDLRILLGNIEQALGQYENAFEHLTAALRLARRNRSQTQIIEALIGLGWVNMRQGRMERARNHSEEAVEMVRDCGEIRLLVEASHLNGLIDVIEGRNIEAEELLLACLPLARTLPDRMQAANILNALGTAQESLGHHAAALDHLTEALDVTTLLGNRYLAANVQGNLGRLHYYQRHDDQAKAYFLATLPIVRAVGNVFGEASALCFLGFIAIAEDDYRQATELLENAIQLSLQIGAATLTLIALCGMTRLLIRGGYHDDAVELLGMILYQANDAAVEREAVPLLNSLSHLVSPETLDASLQQGQSRDIDGVLRDLARLMETIGGVTSNE